jgi:hypothetical protein
VVEQREGGMWGGDELEDNRRRCKLDAYYGCATISSGSGSHPVATRVGAAGHVVSVVARIPVLPVNRELVSVATSVGLALSAPRRIFGQCDVCLRRSPLSLQQFDWVKEVAGYFDIVVLAGDLLDVGSLASSECGRQEISKQGERKDPTAYLLWES